MDWSCKCKHYLRITKWQNFIEHSALVYSSIARWEVATDGMTPYNDMSNPAIFAAKMKENADPLKYIGKLPDGTPQVYQNLIGSLLEWKPSKRPLLTSALHLLKTYIDSISFATEATSTNVAAFPKRDPFDNCDLFTEEDIGEFSAAQQKLFRGASFYFRKNVNKAIEYLEKAEQLDHPLVQRSLGLCYQANGEEYESFLCFRNSAFGDHRGKFYLAWCFEHGYGTECDKAGALILYALATAFDVTEATAALHDVESNQHVEFEDNLTVGNEYMKIDKTLQVAVLIINDDGQTLLHWAAENGHSEVMRLLAVGLGADINAIDNNEQTPLYWALKGGHVEVLKILTLETLPMKLNFKGILGLKSK